MIHQLLHITVLTRTAISTSPPLPSPPLPPLATHPVSADASSIRQSFEYMNMALTDKVP